MAKYSHILLRTSPKGQVFVAECPKCGEENLKSADLWTCTVPDSGDDVVVAITAEGVDA